MQTPISDPCCIARMGEIATEEVKLLGKWESHFVIRVGVALNLKGVKYEFLDETFGVKSELLLKSNPIYKMIPVLIHDGKPLCESAIIVEFIDQVWASSGPSVLPSDPYDRAIARFWTTYIDDKWYPSLFGILKAKTEEGKAAAAVEAHACLQVLEDVFEECSKGKDFFGGDTIGYLDIALGCYLGWVGAAEEYGGVKLLDEEKIPRLVSWAERFRLVNEVKEVLMETHRFVEFGKKLQAMWDGELCKCDT